MLRLRTPLSRTRLLGPRLVCALSVRSSAIRSASSTGSPDSIANVIAWSRGERGGYTSFTACMRVMVRKLGGKEPVRGRGEEDGQCEVYDCKSNPRKRFSVGVIWVFLHNVRYF